MKIYKLIPLIIITTLISCEKSNDVLPGDKPYCMECFVINTKIVDTCADLKTCNAIEKNLKINNDVKCYYKPQNK